MTDIALSPVTDWAEPGKRWRELEARANCSFFQSWTWTGCLAEERFPDPVLLQAEREGTIVALALFNRRRGRSGRETLWLGESGTPALDSAFIEHNGLLRDVAAPGSLLGDCVNVMLTAPIGRHRGYGRCIVLSGIDDATLLALQAGGHRPWVHRSLAAPYVDLASLRGNGRNYLDVLSANSRYQLRRSDRAYEALGGLVVQRAKTKAEAHEFLKILAGLHQATWIRRGKPGAFANPLFVRFHHELIERGMPRGEIELLRITAGEQVVGLLYNYRFHNDVLAYQSGFDYDLAGRHGKPGLTCHHLAIERAIADGMDRYDFLAGEDRYKRSLANAETVLHWVEVGAGVSMRRHAAGFRDWLRGMCANDRGREGALSENV